MGKAKRLKGKRKQSRKGFIAEFSDRLTENFQRELRNSEFWGQMVAEFGGKRAQEILSECKAEVTVIVSAALRRPPVASQADEFSRLVRVSHACWSSGATSMPTGN